MVVVELLAMQRFAYMDCKQTLQLIKYFLSGTIPLYYLSKWDFGPGSLNFEFILHG